MHFQVSLFAQLKISICNHYRVWEDTSEPACFWRKGLIAHLFPQKSTFTHRCILKNHYCWGLFVLQWVSNQKLLRKVKKFFYSNSGIVQCHQRWLVEWDAIPQMPYFVAIKSSLLSVKYLLCFAENSLHFTLKVFSSLMPDYACRSGLSPY